MSAAHTGTLYSQFVFNIKLGFSDLYTHTNWGCIHISWIYFRQTLEFGEYIYLVNCRTGRISGKLRARRIFGKL